MHSGLLVLARDTRFISESIDLRISQRFPEYSDTRQLLHNYRGIGGIPWPNGYEVLEEWFLGNYVDTLPVLPVEVLEKALEYAAYVSLENEIVDTILIVPYGICQETNMSTSMKFMGYDFGFGAFSTVLNDVIFGTSPGLSRFSSFLNSSLLFDTIDIAHEFGREREQLIKEGVDLESYRTSCLIGVYAFAKMSTTTFYRHP